MTTSSRLCTASGSTHTHTHTHARTHARTHASKQARCIPTQVRTFYTAPTLIRALEAAGDKFVTKNNLSSLRILGTVGEPINAKAWNWYHDRIGGGKCPIVDTWWQTETGAILLTPLPGAWGLKPGSATLPFFGVQPVLLDDKVREGMQRRVWFLGQDAGIPGRDLAKHCPECLIVVMMGIVVIVIVVVVVIKIVVIIISIIATNDNNTNWNENNGNNSNNI